MGALWVLVAWAVTIRAELLAIAPKRDRTTDGSVGDLAHQGSPSGHNPDETGNAERRDADNINEVRAIDVDKDLNLPGLTMAMVVAYLVGRCRAGKEKRLIYIIYNRVIWAASSGWVAREYTGSSPHDEHAHLSGHPDADNDGRPFGLASLVEGDDMSAEAEGQVHSVYTGMFAGGSSMGRSVDPDGAGKAAASNSLVAKLDYLMARVDGVAAGVTTLAGKDWTDEPAIVAGVLAGLGPDRLAQAIRAAGLTPEALAAAVPPTMARQVVAELTATLAAGAAPRG